MIDRAPNVCTACKNRKRACDKQLPRCGYCVKTYKACVYHEPSNKTSPTDSSCSSSPKPGSQKSLPLLGELYISKTSDLDALVRAEVSHALSCTGYSLDGIIRSYFGGGLHQWLPIIAPDPFRCLLNAGITKDLPADVLLLVLAVAAVTVRPRPDLDETHIGHPRSLCALTKTLHTFICTHLPPSRALVQALLLVVRYEYACSHMGAAFVSVGACARMAQIIGLDQEPDALTSHSDSTTILKVHEPWNIWWGIVIMERLILCETNYSNPPTLLWRPSKSYPLPFSLYVSGEPGKFLETAEDGSTLHLCDVSAAHVHPFGRQAQAVYLLQQVMEITSSTLESHANINRRQQIDNDLHYLLRCLMPGFGASALLHCSSISTSIRALYLLHTHKWETLSRNDWAERSAAALDSITRMVVDIAKFHTYGVVLVDADRYAVTTMYISRDALECMEQAIQEHGDNAENRQDLGSVLAMQRMLHKRWSPRSR